MLITARDYGKDIDAPLISHGSANPWPLYINLAQHALDKRSWKSWSFLLYINENIICLGGGFYMESDKKTMRDYIL